MTSRPQASGYCGHTQQSLVPKSAAVRVTRGGYICRSLSDHKAHTLIHLSGVCWAAVSNGGVWLPPNSPRAVKVTINMIDLSSSGPFSPAVHVFLSVTHFFSMCVCGRVFTEPL